MVSVDGRGAPRFRHSSFEEAFKEAVRIRTVNANHHRGIRVLQEIAFIPPSYNVPTLDFRTVLFYTDVKVSVGFALDMMARR